MSELSCKKINLKRFKNLEHLIITAKNYSYCGADFHLCLIKAMNPKKMSYSDFDTFNDLEAQYKYPTIPAR